MIDLYMERSLVHIVEYPWLGGIATSGLLRKYYKYLPVIYLDHYFTIYFQKENSHPRSVHCHQIQLY